MYVFVSKEQSGNFYVVKHKTRHTSVQSRSRASRAGFQVYHASQGQGERAPTPQLLHLHGLDLAWSVNSQPAPGVGDAVRAAADVGAGKMPGSALGKRLKPVLVPRP